MYNRLLNYIKPNTIIVDNQFELCQEHYMNMALIKMVDDITEEMDNCNFSLSIFMELAEAFDMVDHTVWLKKNK